MHFSTLIFIFYKALLESIPAEHRLVLSTSMSNQTIETLTVGPMKSIGTTFIPVVFTEMQTGESFRVVLYAIVVPNLFIGMFIGQSARFIKAMERGRRGIIYTFDFGY
jgi:hypothetical protein